MESLRKSNILKKKRLFKSALEENVILFPADHLENVLEKEQEEDTKKKGCIYWLFFLLINIMIIFSIMMKLMKKHLTLENQLLLIETCST